jgi:hypothetical protein
MFNSGILDVVIGVVVVYLQLSLVCTAVNELVALWLGKRAKELEKGIRGLLTKPELVDKFYDHPLIKGLQPDGRKPSYIPSRTFSLALMDIVRRHSFDGTVKAAAQAVTDKTAARDAAQTAVTAATATLTAAQGVNQAATEALTAAGAADKLQASKNAQEAANNEAAAQTASDAATAKLAAAELELTEATTNQTNVTAAAAAAQQAETAAQTAEAAAKADPKNETLKAAAKAARENADTAVDALAPSASSLLSEARDKLAGVQSDVVPPELKTALLALMDNAGTNLNKAQANIEQWFDDAMDRVSGAYKRKSHVFVVIMAVLVTVLANVDTLQLADALSHDKALRETLVAAAPELAKADTDLVNKERGINPDGSSASSTPAPTPKPTPEGGANSNPTNPNPKGTPATTPTATPLPTPSLSTIKASLNVLKEFGLPIGYVRVCTPNEEKLLTKDEQATADAVAAEKKASSLKAESQAAKADADKNPNDTVKKDAAEAAQKKATEADDQAKEARKTADAQKEKTPQCRKKSELSASELKRRLPTTGDNDIWSYDGFRPAVGALEKDILELIYTHWLGWALTAFAVSLGAPFWFDMLNKLIVVRSTVKPHEKSKEQESKDNPDEKDGSTKT